MIESPEFIKSFYSIISAAIVGITGAGYRKIKKIDSDISNRPTYHHTEKLIDSKVESLSIKQDYTIKKLEDIQNDVTRLENYIISKHNG